jgi:hypothetical protein
MAEEDDIDIIKGQTMIDVLKERLDNREGEVVRMAANVRMLDRQMKINENVLNQKVAALSKALADANDKIADLEEFHKDKLVVADIETGEGEIVLDSDAEKE